MTYLDGIHAGLYVLGVLTPLLALGLLVLAARLADVPHRVRVAKLRRNDRRSGRGMSLTAAELRAVYAPDDDA